MFEGGCEDAVHASGDAVVSAVTDVCAVFMNQGSTAQNNAPRENLTDVTLPCV